MRLRVPVVEMDHEAFAVRPRPVDLGVAGRRAAEEPMTFAPAPEREGVVDGVTGLVTENLHAPFLGAALHLEHLVQLEPPEARVRQVEGHCDARNAVRREPLVRDPEVRLEAQPVPAQLAAQPGDALLQRTGAQRKSQIAQPHVEQLLVGELRPLGGARVGTRHWTVRRGPYYYRDEMGA